LFIGQWQRTLLEDGDIKRRRCIFRGHPATHFGMSRPRVSGSSSHPFRCESTARFGIVRPSFSFFVSGAAA
jgi:hypothetical protein